MNEHAPQRAYLDHASSSPLRAAAFDAMVPYLRDHIGDPSRLHQEAHITRVAIEDARAQVAAFVGARPREVMFASTGTEAINTAHWWAHGHMVSTAVEHSAVREAIERTGADCTIVGVDSTGRVDAAEILDAFGANTTLVSVQLANHEVGTLQPVAELCAAIRSAHPSVRTHVDACAAFGHVPLNYADLGADFVSITAHKCGGPTGAAALLIRKGIRIDPFIVGGSQERARRGGIENTAAIVGFGAMCAAISLETERAHSTKLIAAARAAVLGVDGTKVYGPTDGNALPHLLCFSVDGVEAEPILLALDQRGVAIHSGSACSSETWEPSPVLAAMNVDAQHSLRISVGWNSTSHDIERFAAAFPAAVAQLRSLRT